jgi:hypothetical protein
MMRDRFCHCRGSCRSRGGLLSPLNSPNVIEWSDRSSPSEYIEATGIKRREYGNAGRVIKLCSNHVEVKLDQGTLYHYDGMYLSYFWEDKSLTSVFDTVTIQSVSTVQYIPAPVLEYCTQVPVRQTLKTTGAIRNGAN